MTTDIERRLTDRLTELESRVALLECRERVLRPHENRRILDVLDRYAKSPFNDGTLAMKTPTICGALGLPSREIYHALAQLQVAMYVQLVRLEGTDDRWQITEDGTWALFMLRMETPT